MRGGVGEDHLEPHFNCLYSGHKESAFRRVVKTQSICAKHRQWLGLGLVLGEPPGLERVLAAWPKAGGSVG